MVLGSFIADRPEIAPFIEHIERLTLLFNCEQCLKVLPVISGRTSLDLVRPMLLSYMNEAGYGVCVHLKQHIDNSHNLLEILKILVSDISNTHLFTQNHAQIELTSAERSILSMLAEGRQMTPISVALNRSQRTTEKYLQSLKGKLNVQTNSQLIYKAVCLGVLS